ncbi:MAG: AlkA N-terminal domain-containing protein [Bacillota bacterium]
MHPLKPAFAIPYIKPYDFDALLRFYAGRAVQGIEAVIENGYYFTAAIGSHRGVVGVTNRQDIGELTVSLSDALLPNVEQIMGRIENAFDTHCDPKRVGQTLVRMNEFEHGLYRPGIRVPGCFDGFEMAVRAILEQQISTRAACTIAQRIVVGLGSELETEIDGLSHNFPTAEQILSAPEGALCAFGASPLKAQAIRALAYDYVKGRICLRPGPEAHKEIKMLLDMKGIGPWTSQYIGMRALKDPNAFMDTDAGVKKALPGLNSSQIAAIADAWKPYRAYALMCLWNASEA